MPEIAKSNNFEIYNAGGQDKDGKIQVKKIIFWNDFIKFLYFKHINTYKNP